MPTRALLILAALLALLAAIAAGSAQGADEYRIEVDVANQITTVYRRADDAVVRQMICSTGVGDSTPRGAFTLAASRALDRQEWYFIGKYQCFVRYPTRIRGSILFHSLPYSAKDLKALDMDALAQLGSKASHGCVRLHWRDAQWIAENCPDGTETRVFTGAARKEALRERLLHKSFRLSDGQSYAQFAAGVDEPLSNVLGRGDEGEAVAALQRRLRALGWYGGRITGAFDTATAVALMRCQAACGLAPSGRATPSLVRRIMAAERPGK